MGGNNKKNAKNIIGHLKKGKGSVRFVFTTISKFFQFDFTVPCMNNDNIARDDNFCYEEYSSHLSTIASLLFRGQRWYIIPIFYSKMTKKNQRYYLSS